MQGSWCGRCDKVFEASALEWNDTMRKALCEDCCIEIDGELERKLEPLRAQIRELKLTADRNYRALTRSKTELEHWKKEAQKYIRLFINQNKTPAR